MKPEKKPARKGGTSKPPPAKDKKGVSSPAPKAKAKKTVPETRTVKADPEPAKKPVIARTAPVSPPAKASPTKPVASDAAPKATIRVHGPPKSPPPRPQRKLNIPPILLEGDSPVTLEPRPSGPGSRYALAPQAPAPQVPMTAAELPESYGTGRLFLSARDPHWLYAAWDLPAQSQTDFNAKSRDGHLVLRVFANEEAVTATPDIHVHPESRAWFIYVNRAETRYRAQLGYYDDHGNWRTVSISRSTFTPPDAPSQEIAAEFATIPAKVTFQQIVETVQEFVTENRSLVEAIILANQAEPDVTLPVRVEPGEAWTPEKIAEITALFTIDQQRRVWMGSLEITELIRRRLEEEVSSIAAAQLAREQPEMGVSSAALVSSPYGGEGARKRKFWFNINAELVIYGATEPDATVTVADRKIKLRPDGSFSFRFALPDGRYDLPVAATSADREEKKEARLQFSRATDYRGEVSEHPQDSGLRKPSPENVH